MQISGTSSDVFETPFDIVGEVLRTRGGKNSAHWIDGGQSILSELSASNDGMATRGYTRKQLKILNAIGSQKSNSATRTRPNRSGPTKSGNWLAKRSERACALNDYAVTRVVPYVSGAASMETGAAFWFIMTVGGAVLLPRRGRKSPQALSPSHRICRACRGF